MKSSRTAASASRIVRQMAFVRRSSVALAVGLFLGPNATAQSRAADLPIAQALFEEGRALMGQARYPEACLKLAESQRLDPASGTLLNLAVCHEKQGKTATAWAEYNDVVAVTRREGNAERQRIASGRIRELAPKLCHVSVISTSDVPKGSVLLTVDGVALGSAALGTAVPLDPGDHMIEVQSHGKTLWSDRIHFAGDGASSTITLVGVALPERDGRAAPTARGDQRWMYAFGATGAVAVGVGTYFGLRAKSDWDERTAHCPANRCDEQAVSAAKAARTSALAADIAFGVGLVGLGLASYLVFASPSKPMVSGGSHVDVLVSPNRAFITAGGHF